MTNSRKFYAAQAPRGFANEINVHAFSSRAGRDAWVSTHENDGDVNAASQGARAITAARAHAILGYRGDAATRGFNRAIEH